MTTIDSLTTRPRIARDDAFAPSPNLSTANLVWDAAAKLVARLQRLAQTGALGEPQVASFERWGPKNETFEELWQLTQLPRDWDSYDGLPMTPAALSNAMTFLAGFVDADSAAPSVVPMSDGGVQLEWHRGDLDVEVSFPTIDEPELYIYDLTSGEEFQGDPLRPGDLKAYAHRLRA